MTDTETKPADNIKAVCAELGLTMTAQFVPFSQSRNAKPREDGKVWRSLNWIVSLWRGPMDSRRIVLMTEYGAGIGHCEANKASVKALGSHGSIMRDKAINEEIEIGRKWSAFGFTRHEHKPELCDVVASLVMDSSVLDCGTFEEWASEYGYDTDSRKAETIYRACLEIALKLRAGIGEEGLAKLRDACQDY